MPLSGKSFSVSVLLNAVLSTFTKKTKTFCHFQLVSATPMTIKANHTSPDGLQAENITFTLSPTIMASGCRVSVRISCDILLRSGCYLE